MLTEEGEKLECRYKAPWKEQIISTLSYENAGKKKIARNEDRLNIHNPKMISIWRANIECRPFIS